MNASLIFDNHRGRKVYQVKYSSNWPLQVATEVYRNGVIQAKVVQYGYDYKQPANNRSKKVSKEALNALKQRARDTGKVLSLCSDYQAALRLLRFGGELVQVRNLGKGVRWGTLR